MKTGTELEDNDVHPETDILEKYTYLQKQWQLNMHYYRITSCSYNARKIMISELLKKNFQDR
jgi:hypothetical protein